jgi:RNA polymerase sigma-70 factor, ECF subfamily
MASVKAGAPGRSLPAVSQASQAAQATAASSPLVARQEVADEVLMARFQSGDRAAFVSLVRKHKTALYNFVLRLVRSPAAAEDLVQDVFVKIVQSAVDFKHESKFSTWAYTIARNICIDHLRKMSLRQHQSLDQPRSEAEDGPTLLDRTADLHPGAAVERSVIGTELGQRIAALVEALPQEQREVFLLREVADLAFKEIAAITSVPENTVKSRMRYALERLQEGLVEYEDYARALR